MELLIPHLDVAIVFSLAWGERAGGGSVFELLIGAMLCKMYAVDAEKYRI